MFSAKHKVTRTMLAGVAAVTIAFMAVPVSLSPALSVTFALVASFLPWG